MWAGSSKRLGGLILLLLAALPLSTAAAPTWRCRFHPGSTHAHCGLPMAASNFQGYYGCNDTVKIGRPRTVEELQAIVAEYPQVKGVGVGHSWWRNQFCAGSTNASVNIVLTEIKPTLDLILAPVDPAQRLNRTMPEDFPIRVDEDARTVTVAAGVPQRILLDYLAAYKHWREPSGWILPAFTWFVDQTIGGAVATGSHGSSMRHGSLSSQVVSLKVALANGTLAEVSRERYPHLFRALGVSVGRLGVITELTMKIVPQMVVEKKVQVLNFTTFAEQVLEAQIAYAEARGAGDIEGMKEALLMLDETQAFWYLPLGKVYRVDYSHVNKTAEGIKLIELESPLVEPGVQGQDGPSDNYVFDQLPHEPQATQPRLISNDATYWARYYEGAGREYVTPGNFSSRKAFLSMTESGVRLTANFAPYDQFEVAVDLAIAGTCLKEVGAEIYSERALSRGFRTPPLIRFVGAEDFYLSNSQGSPAMYVNMEDYVTHNQGGLPNQEFLRVVQLFLDKCNARLHWGKNGWPQFEPCFDGTRLYPDTWCQFGCAVQELDPHGKFASQSNVWQFNATHSGQPVPFASCCTASQGFNPECRCAARGACSN